VTVADQVPTAEHLAVIYDAAARAYPREACGFVRTSGVRECVNAVETAGASTRTAHQGYTLGATDVLELAHSLDGDDPVVLIYHSHPDVGAYFSAEDQKFAVVDGAAVYPVDHLVIDVTAAGVRGARRYRFSPAAGQYVLFRSYEPPEVRGR
jgi:proteasome lid subunit RPN8/RPN11